MFGGGWVEGSARATLAQLQERIGAPGLAAAAALPGLVAVIDQHAAAVRDILSFGVDGGAVAGVVLLAGYAKGLLDQARDLGWRPELPTTWADADWLTTRLVAICDLARRADSFPAPDPSLEACEASQRIDPMNLRA